MHAPRSTSTSLSRPRGGPSLPVFQGLERRHIHRPFSGRVGGTWPKARVVGRSSSSSFRALVFPAPRRPGKARTLGSRDVRSCFQEGDRAGSRPQRVLLTGLFGPQKVRGVASRLRSVSPERFPGRPPFHDGVSSIHPEISQDRHVGDKHRYQGRLSPCPHSQGFETISQVSLQGQGLSVQSASIRGVYSPVRIHSDRQISGSQVPCNGNSFSPLHRRLACSSRLTSEGDRSRTLCPSVCHPVGLDTKLGQVEPRAVTELRIHRCALRSGQGSCSPPQLEGREDISSHSRSVVFNSNSSSMALSDRSPGVYRKTSSIRPLFSSPHPVVSCSSVEHYDGSTGLPGSFGRESQGGVMLVASPRVCLPGHASQRFCAGSDVFLGRFRTCLGSSHGADGAVREVDLLGTTATHQRPRTEGSDVCVRSLVNSVSLGDTLASLYGQHDRGRPYKQAGRDKVPLAVFGGRVSDQVGLSERSRDQSQASSGQTQCPSRLSLSPRQDSGHGVESLTSGVQGHMQGLWDAEHRPVRDVSQPQAARVLLSSSRERGLQHRRDVPQLGRHVRVCISSDRSPQGGATQDSTVEVHSAVSGTMLAKPAMVPLAPEPAGGEPQGSPVVPQTAQAARQGYFPRFRRGPQASRLEIIQQSYQQAGFPEDVSRHLSRKNRISSARTYQAKWRVFVRWCDGRRLDPVSASVKDVLSFLCYLFDRLSLKPSTIEGYRAMLNPIFRSRGIDLSSDHLLSDLMTSFRTQRPRVAPSLPEWDLAFVLYCLTREPWEPLQDLNIRRLTLKTFFLLLFASGRRRSDLGAIDVTRTAFRSDGSLVLYPERGFLPKTRAATEGEKAFSPIVIPSLSSLVGSQEQDACLCPVRVVRQYITCSNTYRRGRHRLFLSFQRQRSSNITNQTLSLWVKLLVRAVYAESGAESRDIYRISAHQVRHISMSLASHVGAPLESLVRAGMWTNPNTFISHYLSEATELVAQTGRFRLGPLVSAQVPITPHH